MRKPKHYSYRRPWLYPKQEAALFTLRRLAIVEASTKSGKTFAALLWLLEQALMGRPGTHFWWVAPVTAQAHMAFNRLKSMLPKYLFGANETRMTIRLANGATIWFKGGDRPDTLYGEDVVAVVIDEATRCKEDSWHAVRSTVTATRGRVRIIGNVRGRHNWAYELARRAEAGDPDMHYAKITAHDAADAGIIAADEIIGAQRDLPRPVFEELYLAQPSDDQSNPFGFDAIRRCTVPLLSVREPVVWGWDLAKSVDWTVGIALDDEGMVCRFVRRQGSWATMLRLITAETGSVPALVDSTGVGDAILEQLQQTEGSWFSGFHFSAQSKQQLMEGLAVAIQQRRIAVPVGPITAELESFGYEYRPTGVRYSAPERVHDDCVCALALAVRHFATVFAVKPLRLIEGPTEYNPNTPFQRLWTRLHAPPVSRDWRCPQPDDGMPSSESVGPNETSGE